MEELFQSSRCFRSPRRILPKQSCFCWRTRPDEVRRRAQRRIPKSIFILAVRKDEDGAGGTLHARGGSAGNGISEPFARGLAQALFRQGRDGDSNRTWIIVWLWPGSLSSRFGHKHSTWGLSSRRWRLLCAVFTQIDLVSVVDHCGPNLRRSVLVHSLQLDPTLCREALVRANAPALSSAKARQEIREVTRAY